MSNLRDEVENQLVQYAIRMESPIIASTVTIRFTDAILAAVVDALMSDDAISAGYTAYMEYPDDEDVLSGWLAGMDAALEAGGVVKGEVE